ncbi:MAG: hypothetical protein HY701_06590, partial [Gemmatimonadetes bacterium]|nr:hypothetical protein [Gemmatimonadota bacterium]
MSNPGSLDSQASQLRAATEDTAGEASRVLQARRAKLAALVEKGIPPYAYRFERTHAVERARAEFQQAEAANALNADGQAGRAAVAGRVVSYRSHGKTAFADLVDASGKIQLYFRLDALSQDRFSALDLLDLGDWLGVRGTLFRTRAGEITLRVEHYELLAKSLRPLPLGKEELDPETGERVIHSGIVDVEGRYRQRYV